MPLSELRAPFERYAASGEINTRVQDPLAVIERVADHYAGADQDRLDGLTVDGRRLVVQPPSVQHRAAAAAEPRGRRPEPRARARVAEVQAVMAG